MNILIIDTCEQALDLALRAGEFGHKVKVFLPPRITGELKELGDGMIDKVKDWPSWMDWADLIIITDNIVYERDLAPYFKKGYPIFGANMIATALETDRAFGQKVIAEAGIPTIPYQPFHDFNKAIAYVKEQCPKCFVSKPLGDETDKGLSYVPSDSADLLFKLKRWKEEGKLKKGFILQEMVKGVEMAVGGWFGPGGWNQYLCENWEEKRMMNDGLGINTGEQGTTLRYVKRSKLFEEALEPLTDYLSSINYVGYVDMNCIVVEEQPMPLELTMRFGWPLQQIQQALHLGDPVSWMLDLLQGKDTLKVKEEIAVGVVISHGDYPFGGMHWKAVSGFPITGVPPGLSDQVHWASVKNGVAPALIRGKLVDLDMPVTAGDYVAIITGTGKTIEEAREDCYDVAWEFKIPSNRGFRTDIGKRLEDELPLLQKYGFAKGLKYG